MAVEGIDDDEMAHRVGTSVSVSGMRKLRLGERNPSLKRAQAIAQATDGKVGLMDWFEPRPCKRRRKADGAAAPVE